MIVVYVCKDSKNKGMKRNILRKVGCIGYYNYIL